MMMKTKLMGGLLGVVLWGLSGCSTGNDVSRELTAQPEMPTAIARQRALDHFIEGSIYELKGEYAQAILEYQDALRYDKNHAIYYALSKDYASLKKNTLAIEAGRMAVRLAPENVEYRRNLGVIFAAAFELDSATVQYEEVVKRDSNDIEAWYNLARLYQPRKPLKAIEVYNRVLERFGDQWDVLLQKAELYNSLGQFSNAAEALKRMTDLDPGNVELRRSLAQTYVRAEEYDKAREIYEDLRKRNPENLDYITELAGVYLVQKDYAKARETFEAVIVRDSVDIETKLRIGELYFGQLEKDSTLVPLAQSIFERIKTQYPEDWRPYWFLGAIGAIAHDDSLSVENFRKVTELASWNADAWVYLSSTFLDQNNFAEVVKVLESAISVLPDDYRVNAILGIAFSRLGRNEDAVRVLEHAHTINPKDMTALSQLALVYDNLKMFSNSDSLYEEALRIEPDNHLILNNYAYSLADRNVKLPRALTMAQKAVEAQPENQSYLDTMGWVYYRMDRYDEAETYVKKAIDLGNANAVLYEHLGDIYAKMHETQKAIEQWNIALQLDEQNEALREKISNSAP